MVLPLRERKTRPKKLYHPWVPYLFVAPAMLYFLIICYLALGSSLYLSFHKWDILSISKNFIGLKNYISLLKDPIFLISVKNTMVFVFLTVGIGVPMALLLAMGANTLLKPIKLIVRGIFFIPLVCSMVAVSLIWRWIYEPMNGVNGLSDLILNALHLPDIHWLTDPKTALLAIVITCLWKNIGYNMIIFLAGLQEIPLVYYEAAEIDGANKFEIFKAITLPMLSRTIEFVFITSVIGAFQVFTEVFVMTSAAGMVAGGPIYSTRTIIIHIYETAFTFLKMGRASAAAVIFLGIILIFSLLQLRLFKRSHFEY